MANLAQLKLQIKTLNDFTKVVNIQKIVIMKEIAHWQKVIEQSRMTQIVFIQLLKKMKKKYRAVSPNIFIHDKMTKNVPINRNLHFLFQGNVQDALSDYEFKIIEQFCKKNHQKNDVYIVVGKDLSAYLKNKGFNILSTLDIPKENDLSIYQRMANLIYKGHDDLLFVQATLGFLDISIKKFIETNIFPFETLKTKEESKNYFGDFAPILDLKLAQVEWIKDFDSVTSNLIKNGIEADIYLNIVKYSLAMKRRELQSLDDKEKNIKEEIEKIMLKMQRVRKDAVTNELLTNATAFEALSKEEE